MSRTLTCELCGSPFKCGFPGTCWCSGVSIAPERRKHLSQVAKDCVCRNCLEESGRNE